MERITCEHEETKESLPIRKNGKRATLNIASCLKCRQIRKWYDSDEGEDWLAKIGRIDGKIVMPRAGQNLVVTPEESRLVREGWDQINSSTSRSRTRLRRQEETEMQNHPEQEPEITAEEPNAEMEPDLEPEQETEVENTREPKPEVFVIPDMSGWSRKKKSLFYVEHRQQLLRDLAILGTSKMILKWQISTTGWDNIKKRWRAEGIEIPGPGGVGTTKRRYSEQVIKPGYPVAPSNAKPEEKEPLTNTLPPFPTFDGSWPMGTQIEWIQAFRDMILGKVK